MSNGQETKFDYYLLSAGCGSPKIGRMIGLNIPIFPFKGYSIDAHIQDINYPTTFVDEVGAYVRMSPLEKRVWISSYADIDIDMNPRFTWVENMREFCRMFGIDFDSTKLWVG